MFLPESPRWLIDHGKPNEAFQAFNAVRAESSEDSAAIELEFEALLQQIKMEEGEPTSFADLFRIPSLRKRCIVGFLALFAAQGTATLVINNYGPYLYRSLGFSTVQQLVIKGGWISVCPFGNLFNALVVDKVGRCKLLMWGFAGCIVALAGECITVSKFQEKGTTSMAGAAVFFLFLHIVFFSSTTDATTYIYAAEICECYLLTMVVRLLLIDFRFFSPNSAPRKRPRHLGLGSFRGHDHLSAGCANRLCRDQLQLLHCIYRGDICHDSYHLLLLPRGKFCSAIGSTLLLY